MNRIGLHRGRLVALVSALAVIHTGAASGMAHSPDPVLSENHWAQNQRLEFHWRGGLVPPAWVQSEVLAAVDDSNRSKASRAGIFAYDASSPSYIGYGEPSGCGSNGIACFTRTVPYSFTMSFRRQGYVFDWGVLRWCQAYETWPDGCFDVENIALDEFGHVQILHHHVLYPDASDYLDAVMNTTARAKPRPGWNVHRYGRCDTATLQREYDVPTSWTPISTCLDLATVASLRASDTSVAYGGSVTFSATLRTAANTSYERLSGNLLSGRDVILQRRPSGTTSWISVGAMPVGDAAGTYAYTANLTSSADWRAVFRTPADEGLNGDTSGVVTVQVAAPCSGICPSDAEWTVP